MPRAQTKSKLGSPKRSDPKAAAWQPSSQAPRRFDVAVFPLSDAVLFPGTSLPLHIFEARYGKMISDLQAKGWPLAVALVEDGKSLSSDLKLNSICVAGEVQIYRDYGDGRSDILVHGERRVRLLRFVQREPYIVMEAEALDSPEDLPAVQSGPRSHKASRRPSDFDDLSALIQAWSFVNPDVPDELSLLFDQFDPDVADAGALCDFFVFHFIRQVGEKQRYLNCLDAGTRVQRLMKFLEKDLGKQALRQMKAKRSSVLH